MLLSAFCKKKKKTTKKNGVELDNWFLDNLGGCHCPDRMVVGFTTTCVPIPTKVVSLNPFHGEVYLIQHYVIKFVSDLRQVDGFLHVLWFPPLIKLIVII